MSRKTYDVAQLIEMVNGILAVSTCSPAVREGSINVLEGVLIDTDNYRGFRYLNVAEVPAGEKPGINCDAEGYNARFDNTDSTRRNYCF